MERNYINLNFPNVVSITIMAALGMTAIGLISGGINKLRTQADG